MMEDMTENKTEQTGIPPVEDPNPVGTRLREARERMGLSIADVAGQIKFAPRQIEALESGSLEHLPEMAFVRGFVRSYAKILKLDAQELLASISPPQAATGDLTPSSVNVPYPDANFAQRQNIIWLGVALIVVLVVVFVMRSTTDSAEHEFDSQVETPVMLPDEGQLMAGADELNPVTQPEPVPAKTSEQQAVPAAKPAKPTVSPAPKPVATTTQPDVVRQLGSVRVEFIEESWLEVKDADENILTSQNYPAGSEAKIEGNLPLSVLVGHAPSVRLYYKDAEVDLVPRTRPSTDVAFVKLK
jgi:cytoskeleton protein RodZ